MNPVPPVDRGHRLAYGVGVGLVAAALVGVPVRFAFQGIAPVLVYGGSFLLGVVAGFLLAPRMKRSRSE